MHQLRQLFGEGGGYAVFVASGGLVEEVVPDAWERGLLFESVPAVDASALELVELAAEVRRGEEDGWLDARDVKLGGYLVGGLDEAAPEVLRLAVGEVQRVLDRADPVVAAEDPGGAVVSGCARVALDLDEEEAAGGGEEEVNLADVAAGRGEGEGLPGAVGLGVRHLVPDVLEGILFPGEVGLGALPSRRLPAHLVHLSVA